MQRQGTEQITDHADDRNKFLLVYFYVLLISTAIIMLQTGPITSSIKEILQSFFTLLGFVAFFGYVHNKRILTRSVWIVLSSLFFLWEIGCYIFIENPWFANLLILVMLLPKYWSVALYPLITMEMNDETRLSNIRKRDQYISRFKVFFVGIAILATLAQVLIIGIFVVGRYLA